jgi:hypothetical protein
MLSNTKLYAKRRVLKLIHTKRECRRRIFDTTSKMVRKTRKVRPPGPPGCHPRVSGRKKHEGCLPTDVYAQIAGAITSQHNPGTSQEGGRGRQTRSGDVAHLRKSAAAKVGCDEDDSDRCLLENSSLGKDQVAKLAKEYLRPRAPDDWKKQPDKWLDTHNIENVLKQYAEVRPDFKFMGAIPIDFSAPDPYSQGAAGDNQKKCLYDETCKLNVGDLKNKGVKYVGFVFNLDPHFKNGSHWVSMMLDIMRRECNFFDSYGMEPHPLIARLMRSFKLQDPSMTLNYNARRFQFGESQCGMYCIFFLSTMLNGTRFKKFVKTSVPDYEMQNLRKVVFS